MRNKKITTFLTTLHNESVHIQSQIDGLQRDMEYLDRLKQRLLHGDNKLESFLTKSEVVLDAHRLTDDGYDNNWSWDQKVWHVLNEIGTVFATDVAANIKRREPHLEDRKCFDRSTYILSKLYRLGKLDAKQYSRRYKYSIKKDTAEITADVK